MLQQRLYNVLTMHSIVVRAVMVMNFSPQGPPLTQLRPLLVEQEQQEEEGGEVFLLVLPLGGLWGTSSGTADSE